MAADDLFSLIEDLYTIIKNLPVLRNFLLLISYILV